MAIALFRVEIGCFESAYSVLCLLFSGLDFSIELLAGLFDFEIANDKSRLRSTSSAGVVYG